MIEENLKLNGLKHLRSNLELFSTFCLQNSGDFFIMQGHKQVTISKLGRRQGLHENSMQISNDVFENNFFNIIESLSLNETKIFKTGSHQDKMDITLNPDLFTTCVAKNNRLKRSRISPYSDDKLPILANLSANGSLELLSYKIDLDDNTANLEHLEHLTKVRKKAERIIEPIERYSELIEIFNKLSFFTFDWCPKLINQNYFIATLTKSREFIIYSIGPNNDVKSQISLQLDPSIITIKWISDTRSNKEFLLTCDKSGNFIQYLIKFDQYKLPSGIEKIIDISCELNIPANEIMVDNIGSNLFAIACKAHSIEAFLLKKKSKSIVKHIGISISGITKISNSHPIFLISTINNKIFHIEFTANKDNLSITNYEEIKYFSSDLHLSSYEVHGITTSKNMNLCVLALTLKSKFDHLTNKNSCNLLIETISINDPIKILKENSSLSLNGYSDCIEQIHLEKHNLAAFGDIENCLISKEYLYQLKLFLIATRANREKKDENEILSLIQALNTTILLRSFSITKHNQYIYESMRRFLRRFINTKIHDEVLEIIQFKLASEIECEILKKGEISSESCHLCKQLINEKINCCQLNHKLQRCPITNLQLSVNNNSYCNECLISTSNKSTLIEAFSEDFNFLCIYCDKYLIFE